ncbi:Rossmann-like and DUF2520 domain-containing protein [Flavobacterium sp. PLA-1-15]|uniref:Rossmann-like and DUF2520 domain-containing protein n=1 Tax=Flavobacterium sp. PLA-1-15 TaxID=3380533 RepID=UPI003B79F987
MIKVTLIGSGNVAQHLFSAFNKSTAVEIVQVFSRRKETVSNLIPFDKITDSFEDLAEADAYIIAVSDDAIAEVSAQLSFKNRLVVHTSGSASMENLNDDNRKGVFYPLQTFTKGKEVDFKSIPICIESQFSEDYNVLKRIADSISDKVFTINSGQRRALHVAAVFVNNFTNHLYKIGSDICQEHQVPFEILQPLIRETAAKILSLSPNEAQTGPAKRNDQTTIEAHLDFLSDENHKNIYKLLTQSIQDNGTKL